MSIRCSYGVKIKLVRKARNIPMMRSIRIEFYGALSWFARWHVEQIVEPLLKLATDLRNQYKMVHPDTVYLSLRTHIGPASRLVSKVVFVRVFKEVYGIEIPHQSTTLMGTVLEY